MKRFSENRSKSAETLCTAKNPETGAFPTVEPQAKKQRQSTIKQSVRRLFGSVKRLLPSSSQRSKDKQQTIDLSQVPPSTPQPAQQIKKSAAMHEAELFLERLGTDWQIDQVQARIQYLYRLVNDAFERVYQSYLKDRVLLPAGPNANDYMREVRHLQEMIRVRKSLESAQAVEQVSANIEMTMSSVNLALRECKRSKSAEACHLNQPSTPVFPPSQIIWQQQQPTTVPQPVYCVDFSEGLKFNGIENKVYLPNYGLSQSTANVIQANNNASEEMMNNEPAQDNPDREVISPVFEMDRLAASQESILLPSTPVRHKVYSLQRLNVPRSVSNSASLECLEYVEQGDTKPYYSIGKLPKNPEVLQFDLLEMKRVVAAAENATDGTSSRRSSVKDLVELFEHTRI